jgi:hypothetical protein
MVNVKKQRARAAAARAAAEGASGDESDLSHAMNCFCGKNLWVLIESDDFADTYQCSECGSIMSAFGGCRGSHAL